jgi:hypothetical protein
VIDTYLTAYVRRRRALSVVRAFAWAVVTSLACAALACLVDRFTALPAALRAAALVVTAVLPAALVVPPIARLFRRFDPVAAAAAVEREHPAFAHRLVTAASPGGSADLRAAVEREVVDLMTRIGAARVPLRPTVIAIASAAVAIALMAGLWRWPWLDLPDLTRRLVHPTAPIAAVTSTRIAVRPGPVDVVEGRPLTVTAAVTGSIGSHGVVLHLSDDQGQSWTDRPLALGPDGYAVTLADVDRDQLYTVSAGDAVSPTYAVRVRRVPAVVTLRATLDYPARLHRPSTTVTDDLISAPIGTTVTVDLVATVPLARATLSVGSEHVEMTPTGDPCGRRGQFVIRHDDRIAIGLTSTDGVPGAGPRSMRIRVDRVAGIDAPGFADQQRAYRRALRQ